MNTRNQLWLIRHGETEWSLSGAHTGRTDLPLIAAGKERAAAVQRYLAARPFALVLTSPLQRAQETCRIAGYGDIAQLEPNLREWDYGAYEGRTTAEIRKEAPAWDLWTDGVPGGETIEQVAARARLSLAPCGGRLFALDTATVSVLGYERESRVIRHWNRCPADSGAH